MPKLYTYTDESGRGRVPFVVAVVIVGDGRDDMRSTCQRIERESKKGRDKWRKADYDERLAYMRAVVADAQFAGALCFVTFDQVSDYDTATVSAIARAIEHAHPASETRVEIFVDGLTDAMQKEYAKQLRKLVTSFVSVRGVPRDESEPLIRLADAVAGFVNHAQNEHSEAVVTLYERARSAGVLVGV